MIVLSRPGTDYCTAFSRHSQLPPEADDFYFCPRGRDALLLALRALRVMPGSVIVIPAYICKSITDPLMHMGYQIKLVDIERNFQLDPAKVLDVAKKCDAKAVLVVHYFGFPCDVSQLAEQLRLNGIRVIEDCSHSFLTHSGNEPLGSKGDAAIFSMRKTLPIPDGGALRLNSYDFDKNVFTTPAKLAPNVGCYLAIRAAESIVASVGWPNLYSQTVDKFRKYIRQSFKADNSALTDNLELCQQSPSRLFVNYLSSEGYLKKISEQVVMNYVKLIKGSSELGQRPVIPQLPIGCVPQWAVFDDPSGRLVPWLRKHGVGACHWPWHELPTAVTRQPEAYPISIDLNQRLALLPVHQSIGYKQIAHMLHLIKHLVNRAPTISKESD